MARRMIRAIVQIVFLALFVFLIVTGKTNLWLVLFGLSTILAIFFGRIYCGWICPINTVMRPINWIYAKLKLKRLNTPKWLKIKIVPWVLFALLAAAMMAGRVLKIKIPGLLIILALGFIFSLVFKPEVFHNYICPYGALQSLTGRFAKLAFRVNGDKCNGCGLCLKVCDAEAITIHNKKAAIDPKLCHQCNNCKIKCPNYAIDYKNE
ncbi:MAG: 4Fe-4S binding protein [Actinomycetia bacterium]|nr:4Fe-4S binding protein [Actinomycetes bacterium]